MFIDFFLSTVHTRFPHAENNRHITYNVARNKNAVLNDYTFKSDLKFR